MWEECVSMKCILDFCSTSEIVTLLKIGKLIHSVSKGPNTTYRSVWNQLGGQSTRNED